jgi:hypothetical protein
VALKGVGGGEKTRRSTFIPSDFFFPSPPKTPKKKQYDDAAVWRALERAHLAAQIRRLPHGACIGVGVCFFYDWVGLMTVWVYVELLIGLGCYLSLD